MIEAIFYDVIASLAEESPLFRKVKNSVVSIAYDKTRNRFVIVLTSERDVPEKYSEVIERILKNHPKIVSKLKMFKITTFDVRVAYLVHDEEYLSITRSDIRSMRRLSKSIQSLTNEFEDIVKEYETASREFSRMAKIIDYNVNIPDQLYYMLWMFILRLKEENAFSTNLIRNILQTLNREFFGEMSERPLSEFITDEMAEELKEVLERTRVIDWENVPGKTLRQKVINYLGMVELDNVALSLRDVGGGKR